MRRGLGIVGLLIGFGVVLVFGFIPVAGMSKKIPGDIDIYETAFIFSWVLWLLFSAIEKFLMVFKKKNAFVNYATLIMFLSFVYFGKILPPRNSGAEFHLLHNVFGFAIYFGWSTIDAIDLMMTRLLKRW